MTIFDNVKVSVNYIEDKESQKKKIKKEKEMKVSIEFEPKTHLKKHSFVKFAQNFSICEN